MRLQSGCRATLLLLLLLSHAGLDHRVSADGVAQQAGVAAGAREGGREDVILEDWCGSSEPFKSTGDGGAERSCRPRQNATTILPEGFQGCAGQASKVLPCLSTGTGEGVCETARREYSECLASVGNRMIRYKHGYLVMSGSDLLLSAALELYGKYVSSRPQFCCPIPRPGSHTCPQASGRSVSWTSPGCFSGRRMLSCRSVRHREVSFLCQCQGRPALRG